MADRHTPYPCGYVEDAQVVGIPPSGNPTVEAAGPQGSGQTTRTTGPGYPRDGEGTDSGSRGGLGHKTTRALRSTEGRIAWHSTQEADTVGGKWTRVSR